MSGARILLVDDEEKIRETFKLVLEGEGYEVETAVNGQDALNILKEKEFHVLITDFKMPKMNGLQLLKKVKENNIKVVVIFITAYSDIKDAVEAMKLGAFDYLEKNFSTDELLETIKGAVKCYEVLKEKDPVKRLNLNFFEKIVANSKKTRDIMDSILKIADSNTPVLILGEKGTGKEFFARIIHHYSSRRGKPFVALNCRAIEEDLFESELFGYEKGAFLGAVSTKKGKLEQANKGTLFLDEICGLNPVMQSKLFRFLQDKEFERVGGLDTIKVDVRLIAASSEDLKRAVKEGHFREDLYLRLNAISLYLPPLRERKEDIPLLAQHYVEKYNKEYHKNVKTISKEVMDIFMDYDWVGNTRELKNMIERAVSKIDQNADVLLPEHLPPFLASRFNLKANSNFQNNIENKINERWFKE